MKTSSSVSIKLFRALTSVFSLVLAVSVFAFITVQLSACADKASSDKQLISDAHAAAQKILGGVITLKDPAAHKAAVDGLTNSLKGKPGAESYNPKTGEDFMVKLMSHNSFKLAETEKAKLDRKANPNTVTIPAEFESFPTSTATATIVSETLKKLPADKATSVSANFNELFTESTKNIDEFIKNGTLKPLKKKLDLVLIKTDKGWDFDNKTTLAITQILAAGA